MTEENTSETIDPKICGGAALFNKAELKSPLNVMRQIPFLAGLVWLIMKYRLQKLSMMPTTARARKRMPPGIGALCLNGVKS